MEAQELTIHDLINELAVCNNQVADDVGKSARIMRFTPLFPASSFLSSRSLLIYHGIKQAEVT